MSEQRLTYIDRTLGGVGFDREGGLADQLGSTVEELERCVFALRHDVAEFANRLRSLNKMIVFGGDR